MELDLKGKTAFVTGGTRGLGRAICFALAAEGVNLAVNYRNDEHMAKSLTAELMDKFGVKAITVFGDVSSEDQVRNMFDETVSHFAEIDILANNAGICPVNMIKDMSLEEWNRVISINLTGTFITCREMVNRLIEQKLGGSIINIVSQAAYNGSRSGKSHYAASKGGVVSFTHSLAKEVAQYRIRVNGVAPGMVYTDMVSDTLDRNINNYMKEIPIGRIAEAEEVAKAVVFLASEASSYITGSVMDVSGGIIGV